MKHFSMLSSSLRAFLTYLRRVLVEQIDHGRVDVGQGDALPVAEGVGAHPHDVVAALLGDHRAVAGVDHDQGGDPAHLVDPGERPVDRFDLVTYIRTCF